MRETMISDVIMDEIRETLETPEVRERVTQVRRDAEEALVRNTARAITAMKETPRLLCVHMMMQTVSEFEVLRGAGTSEKDFDLIVALAHLGLCAVSVAALKEPEETWT